jgi:Fe-S oxidoreductase
MQSFLLKDVSKFMMGMDSHREIPKFAKKPFTKNLQGFQNLEGLKVILWADTFNNYFFPDTLSAASKVLEKAGFNVIVPQKNFCCGRPLYDFGMLNKAKKYLQNILDSLSNEINSGIPFIGLEPSCVSVFRNEIKNLFPENKTAKKLSESFFTLAEFIERNHEKFQFTKLNSKAIFHGHCHHKAVMKTDADKKILEQLGLNVEFPDSGCCGLAGSFGFERGEKYNLSMQIGERVLFPAVKNADEKTILIADGFSCREQIFHGTKRKALHLAEVLEMAI